jgi:fucose permease
MLSIAVILAVFVYGMIAAMLGTILPTLSAKFGLSNVESKFVAMAQAIGLTIASVSVGPLIDNKGKKWGLVLALSLITAALFGLRAANGYSVLIATMLVLGFGGGVLVTGANALVSDIGAERRATVMNFFNLFFGLGIMATPYTAAKILGGDAERLATGAALMAAFTLAVHVLTKMPAPTGERGFKPAEMTQLLSQPMLYLLALLLFLYVACEVGTSNWLAKLLIAKGVPQEEALLILSNRFAVGLLVGRMVVAPILIKVLPQTVTLAAAAAMSGTTYWMLQASDAATAGVAVFCAGLAMAPVFPTTLAMVGNVFPKATATAMGIVITSGWLGLVLSSPLIGALAGDDPKGLSTGLLVLPVFSVIMIVVNVILRPLMTKAAHTVQ